MKISVSRPGIVDYVIKWLPLLWSNVWRRKVRTSLTMIAVLVTFVIFGLLDSFRTAVATYGNDYANALVVQSRKVRLPYSHVEHLLSMPGVTAASGVLMARARLPSGRPAMIQAVDDRSLFEVNPGIVVSPEVLAAWREDRTGVLISAEVAKDNGWRTGDRLMLPGLPKAPAYWRSDGRNALEVVVAGVFSAQNSVAIQGIYAHYEYVRDLIGADRAGMEYITVRLAPGLDVDVMRRRIDAEFVSSLAPVKTYSYRALLRAYYGTYRELARLAVVVIAIASITLLLISGSVLAQSQRERAGESAILEALGWSKARVAAFLACEATVLLMVPAGAGLVLAGALARTIDSGISLGAEWVPTRTAVASLMLASLFVIATSIIPLARAAAAPIAPRLARD